ncbi:MAG: HAD family phosphatase [Nanoarchaeota archaeon]|nr:HAD family phosphatase [Nanoarchaeota archaeon]
MIKAIIFDMDGVLVDSPKYVWQSNNQLLSKYNIHVSDGKIKKYLGRSLRDQLNLIIKDFGIKEEIDYKDFSKKSFELQMSFMRESVKPNKYINRLIESAKKSGIKLAVGTSRERFKAEKILGMLEILDKLDTIVTEEDVKKHKPYPDVFLKAAEKLKVEPESCVVFEDAVNGIQAARNANMKVVAMKTKFQDESDLKDADLIINNFSEIDIDKLKEIFVK